MNIDEAWRRFERTGSVRDYLIYAQLKNSMQGLNATGAVTNEFQNTGVGNPGAAYGGKRQDNNGAYS